MDIHQQLNDILKKLEADRLPSPVMASIMAEVSRWDVELQREVESKLRARIEKRVTKPWVAKHFMAQFKERQRAARAKAVVAHEGQAERREEV